MTTTIQPSQQYPFGVAAPPLPGRNGDHLITTNFTRWDHLLGFLAEDPEIFNGFVNFYPRVMMQSHVRNLRQAILAKVDAPEGQTCGIYTHPRSLKGCIDFATSPDRCDKVVPRDVITTRTFDIGPQRIWVAFYPQTHSYSPTRFWMNPGVGISTRQAQEALSYIDTLKEIDAASMPLPVADSMRERYNDLQQRVVDIVNTAPLTTTSRPTRSDVYLFPTGMAVIYRLHQYLLATYNLPSVLYGFPFHSTKHIFEDYNPAGHLFLGNADADDLATLTAYLADLHAQGKGIQALWTEFPTNPSCHTPDVAALRKLADQYSFLLIVDDTVASTCNVDLIPSCDILVTSLTKSFSGYADVMGGSLVLNPASPHYHGLQTMLTKHYHNELYPLDASVLLANSADYFSRSAIHNRNGAAIVDFFQSRMNKPDSAIVKIFHPTTLPSAPLYRKYLRPVANANANATATAIATATATTEFTRGFGLLLSVEFTSLDALAAFHDALELYKSPHLGAHVTLVLPYVKGIYQKELDQVAKWGMRETQVRIAPGLEEVDYLVDRFARAVDEAERVVRCAMVGDGSGGGSSGSGSGSKGGA